MSEHKPISWSGAALLSGGLTTIAGLRLVLDGRFNLVNGALLAFFSALFAGGLAVLVARRAFEFPDAGRRSPSLLYPFRRLESVCALLCSKRVNSELLLPLIWEQRVEWAEAEIAGAKWRARIVLLRGYLTVCSVLLRGVWGFAFKWLTGRLIAR